MSFLFKKNSLKINAVSTWCSLVTNVLIGFFLTPFIIRELGKDGYGIWALVISFTGYYGLINLGIGSAVTRFIARYNGQNDATGITRTASTALFTFIFTSILIVLITQLAAAPLAGYFNIAPENTEAFILVVKLLGFAAALTFISSIFIAILKAYEFFVISNVIDITSSAMRTGLTVAFLLEGMALKGVSYALIISTGLGLIASWAACRWLVPEVRFSPRSASFTTLRILMAFGGVTFIITISDILRTNLDSFVVAKWVSVQEVATYNVAAIVVSLVISITIAVSGVLIPRFSHLAGKGHGDEIKRLFAHSLAVSSLIAFCFAALAFLVGASFIELWVGDQFSESGLILCVLIVPTAFGISQSPAISLMYALKKHHYYAIATIIEGIANLTLSIFLAIQYGTIGVALGTMITMMFVKIVVMPVYVSRIASFSLREYWSPLIPPIAVFSCFALAAWLLRNRAIKIGGYPSLIISSIAIAALFFLTSLLLMRKRERSFILSQIPLINTLW